MNMRRALSVAVMSAIIMVLSAPGVAAAGPLAASDSCDTIPMNTDFPVVSCCESGNCFSVCCTMPDIPGDRTTVTYLPVPNKNFVTCCYKTSESIDITVSFDKPPGQDTSQALSFHPYSEYHCRNSLDSEESFHI